MGWFPCCNNTCKIFDSAPWTGWHGGTVTGDTLKLDPLDTAYTDALDGTNEWHHAIVHLRTHADVGISSDVFLDARIRFDDVDEIRVTISDCMVVVEGRFCKPLRLRNVTEEECVSCEDYAVISGGAGGRCEQAIVTAIRCGDYIQWLVDLLNADGERIVLYPLGRVSIPVTANRRWSIKNVGESNLELVSSQGYGSLEAAPNGECERDCVAEVPCEEPSEPCVEKRGGYQIVMEVSGFPVAADFVAYYQSGNASSAENGFDCKVTTTVTGLDQLNGTYIGVPQADPNPCFPLPYVDTTWGVGSWSATRTIEQVDDNGEYCTLCTEWGPSSGPLFARIMESLFLAGFPPSVSANGWMGYVYGFPAAPWCYFLENGQSMSNGNPLCFLSGVGFSEVSPILNGFRVCGTCANQDEEWENFLGFTEAPDPFSGIVYVDPLKSVKIRVYLMQVSI